MAQLRLQQSSSASVSSLQPGVNSRHGRAVLHCPPTWKYWPIWTQMSSASL
jgi:hypothetical protein